jgi:hypothetical protein
VLSRWPDYPKQFITDILSMVMDCIKTHYSSIADDSFIVLLPILQHIVSSTDFYHVWTSLNQSFPFVLVSLIRVTLLCTRQLQMQLVNCSSNFFVSESHFYDRFSNALVRAQLCDSTCTTKLM